MRFLYPKTGVLAGLCACGLTILPASAKAHSAKPAPLIQRERAEHVLDRLTFGSRPGDLERVAAIGVDRWIDEQLHPEKIDDSPLDVKLQAIPAMKLSTEELIRKFPPLPVIRQVDAGRIGIPADPVEHAVYTNALANYQTRKDKDDKAAAAEDSSQPATNIAGLLSLQPAQRWQALLRTPPGTVRTTLQRMTAAQRQQLAAGMRPEQKEILLALVQPGRVVTEEMQDEAVLRAVYSNRQLEEVMTSFWANHFNIYLHKNGEMPWYLAGYERDVIRPYALGRFEDLLVAVAHSPAMLVYLDNQQSIGPHSTAAMRAATNPQQKKGSAGLNENYARELMELHTLGVNGGYTQQDVVELAKVLTGWGTEGRDGFGFSFNERRHEPGDKHVLGHTIHENGESEGMEVLHMLAESPATARFLSSKLATEFVSDTPPKPLIDRMTKTYLKTHGDIRQVMRTMLRSPEFWSRDAYRAKLKTPFEFVTSSLRATNADVENATALSGWLERLGMPLFGVQQPNGYSLKADPWLGAEALLGRMNFALALTANRVPGVSVGLPEGVGEPQLEQTLLDGRVAQQTRDTVLKEMTSAQAQPVTVAALRPGRNAKGGRDPFAPVVRGGAQVSQSELAAALLLGSPDFQRR